MAVYVFFVVILLKYLRKDVKNSVNFYKNFKASIFIKVYMYMYIYNQNKFKYINILSTSIQDMKMSLVPSKLRQISIFKNRENPGSNRPSVPSACRERRLSDESVITEALVQLALAVELQQTGIRFLIKQKSSTRCYIQMNACSSTT